MCVAFTKTNSRVSGLIWTHKTLVRNVLIWKIFLDFLFLNKTLIKFMDASVIIKKWSLQKNCEYKLKLEQINGQLLKSLLFEEKQCRHFEMKYSGIYWNTVTLTKLNETLPKENGEIKNEMEQYQETIKTLIDDLSLKDIRLSFSRQWYKSNTKSHYMLISELVCQSWAIILPFFTKTIFCRLEPFLNHFVAV